MIVADPALAKGRGSYFKEILADPALDTFEIGLIYDAGGLNCELPVPTIPLTPAPAARAVLEQAFITPPASDSTTPIELANALTAAYSELRASGGDGGRRQVLVIGLRQLDDLQCGTRAEDVALTARADPSAPVSTWVVFVPSGNNAAPQYETAKAVALAGSGQGPFDDSADYAGCGLASAIEAIVQEGATCTYELPTQPIREASSLSIFPGPDGRVAFNAACGATTLADINASGWGHSADRIFLCGSACTRYRSARRVGSTLPNHGGCQVRTTASFPVRYPDEICVP